MSDMKMEPSMTNRKCSSAGRTQVSALLTPTATSYDDTGSDFSSSGRSSSDATATAVVPVRRASTSGAIVDDKVLRRRLQYKMHQRRHRAKQKDKIETLEHDVHGLLTSVTTLEAQVKRLRARSVFTTRSTPSGSPARTVLEYFRMYEHGFSHQRCSEQEHFVECITSSSIKGPDYIGIDAFKHQWRLYGQYFAATQYNLHGMDVSVVDDLTIIVIGVTMMLRPRRDGVTVLCPNLAGHEPLIQAVIGNAIEVSGTYRFMFDAEGRLSWLGADMDFVTGLQRTLGSLANVALFMQDARMSFGTGRILCDDLHNSDAVRQDAHNVEYLLS